jgi:hypothetical protein
MKNLQLAFISNKTNARLLMILQFIERNRKFTLVELAENNNVSERTCANDLKYLKEYFRECAVFHSGSKGYTFTETHLTKYKEHKALLFEYECLFEIIKNIFYGKYEDIDDLAYKYNYSVTAFRRLLTKSSNILESYDIFWTSNPLNIGGSEECVRKFFKDFFYEGIETPFTVTPSKELYKIFVGEGKRLLGDYEVGTGTTPQSFYYTLYVTLIRSSQGKGISVAQEVFDRVYQENDFIILSSLAQKIEKVYQFNISKVELAWIYLVTICKRTIDRADQERKFYERFNLWPEVEEVSKRFLVERSISPSDQQKILPFINTFFLSRKINELMNPVLNKELLSDLEGGSIENKQIYKENEIFLRKEQQILCFNEKYFQEICTSFTLYSELILTNYSSAKKLIFLLEGNHFICQAIRIKAQRKFGYKHHLKFIPIQTLGKEALRKESVDLIVTNYDRYVTDIIENQNYVLIKTLPDEQDWQHIESSLYSTE